MPIHYPFTKSRRKEPINRFDDTFSNADTKPDSEMLSERPSMRLKDAPEGDTLTKFEDLESKYKLDASDKLAYRFIKRDLKGREVLHQGEERVG